MNAAARISIVVILAAALILPSPLALACGPFFPVAVFTGTDGPDDPSSYAVGSLQLLQPTYWHLPLFIAYRNLVGRPFSQAELKIFDSKPSPEPDFQATPSADARPAQSPQQLWFIARDQFLGRPLQSSSGFSTYGSPDQFQRGDNYVFYTNCLNGAYRNAVATLEKRVAQFGAQSQAVKDWITAQDQVFQNCSDGSFNSKPQPAVIPAVARDCDPDIIRFDRAYQIAAAYFYAGNYAAALSEFDAIAKDPKSPYAEMAPYLAARTLIRQGTLGNSETEPDPQALDQAETKLRAILADKNLAEIHPASLRLLAFVTIRIHPSARFHELESVLMESAGTDTPTANFDQDLTDYLWMLDQESIAVPALAPHSPSKDPAMSPVVSGDMTDWIFTFHAEGKLAYQHALQRWQDTKSLAWLVAAISKADASDHSVAALIAAAEKFPQDSPASTTLTFHRLRLLAGSGKSTVARDQLDRFLAQPAPKLDRSARNQFLALRTKLATSLDDFLLHAQRNGAVVIPGMDLEPFSGTSPSRLDPASQVSPVFDADSAFPLSTTMPLRLLADAAKSTSLPPALRREIVIAAWTRAILLDNQSTARELTPLLEELVPELKDSLAPYKSAADPTSRRFAAVFVILHNPGFVPYVRPGLPRESVAFGSPKHFNEIDSYGDNWWCPPSPSKSGSVGDLFVLSTGLSTPLHQIYPDGKIPAPVFLTNSDLDEAKTELASLSTQPAAPDWLGQQTLDFAKSRPDDSRIPEALHFVVRATRHGCFARSDEAGAPANVSKQAFTLLHSKYPDSQWTAKTPYWFK